MADALDITGDRFATPEEVAALFRRTVEWVYNNSLPERRDARERVTRKAGFLAPAARRFNAKTLLFDREEIERVIAIAANGP
jgi:hypothetical protein